MDFSQVKSLSIPEGDVAKIQIGGVTVWQSATKAVYNLHNVWDNSDYTTDADTPWNSRIQTHNITTPDGARISMNNSVRIDTSEYPAIYKDTTSISVTDYTRVIKKMTVKLTSKVAGYQEISWSYKQSESGNWINAGSGSSGGMGSGIYIYDASSKNNVHGLSLGITEGNLPYSVEYILVEYA